VATYSTLRKPARVLPLAFFSFIVIGTFLLSLPVSQAGEGRAPFLVALFTATSAACVTGLTVVDTHTYWSPFGQVVLLLLFETGGLGVMVLATLLVMAVSRRLGLSVRLLAQAATQTSALGEARQVVVRVAITMLIFQSLLAALLTARLMVGYDYPLGKALWYGVFHAVSAFNNAGFTLYDDSLTGFVSDPWICLTVAAGVIVGGVGFPVIFELQRQFRHPSSWSMHTKVTLLGTAILLLVGMAAVLGLEWSNPATLGPLRTPDKLLAAFFQGMTPRSAGFHTVDYSAMSVETYLVTIALMFIGGGSASTAGGIKLTTFFLLAFVIWAEARGEPDVVVFQRRLAQGVQRQALAVALLSVAVVGLGTLMALIMTNLSLQDAMFEVTSAATTTGLSTGITTELPTPALVLLVVLMYLGRVGTITVAAALALRSRQRLYRLPEERPIVG